MASAVGTLIQTMKSQTQSMLRVVTDASMGSQKESDGAELGAAAVRPAGRAGGESLRCAFDQGALLIAPSENRQKCGEARPR